MSIQLIKSIKLVALALCGLLCVNCYSLPVDNTHTDGGAQDSFSTKQGVLNTMWNLYDFRLTVTTPTNNRGSLAEYAEPSMGNQNMKMLGHMMKLNNTGSSSKVWVVYDRLAKVYVPHLLYKHDELPVSGMTPSMTELPPSLPMMTFDSFSIPSSDGGNIGGGSGIIPEDAPEFTPVPEPTSLIVMGLAGVMMLTRQRHKSHV